MSNDSSEAIGYAYLIRLRLSADGRSLDIIASDGAFRIGGEHLGRVKALLIKREAVAITPFDNEKKWPQRPAEGEPIIYPIEAVTPILSHIGTA